MPIVSALEGTQAYEFGTELGIQPTEIDWVENMTPYTSTGPFERNDCQVLVTHLIENHNITGTEKELFAVNETTKQYLNSPTDMTLTLVGCKALCGPQTFYVDAGPRFMIWILPVMLLLSNIELYPTDKRRSSALIEVLGNPIDSIRSLTHKLQT